MSEIREAYGDYAIVANQVPEAQFDFGGFGWAFAVRDESTNAHAFTVVLKCIEVADEESRRIAYERGGQVVRQRIDADDHESGGYYCYWWRQPDILEQDDCSNVSPSTVWLK